jgi:hypothetical protein
MGVITIILAPFAFIGIVSLARHLAFRPPAEDSPPASWISKMEGRE